MTITLAGYQTTDLIYDGTRTLVYRGVKTDDLKPVVLKKLRKEYPTFNELLQFRHQYVLSKNLDVPGIVKPIALEKYGNGYVLVMEDVSGVSLSEYISDRPLGIEQFLKCAIAITKILEYLYQNRVIHKDIKPANILINPKTKEIFLIDFSISSLLPRETQEIQNPNVLEGTLAYISPEQTGRMNRGIDYRSDFYSLGVTFYQLLTGKVPFQSDDPMELVHCQIAKTPVLPHAVKPEIPQALSEIVMKLIAKNAEERYQSARGIKQDLERCWQQWQKTGSIAKFKLGERDISDRFLIPEKLYGREHEVQTFLDAFERVAAGNCEMMLVAGFSGIGKTAVVNEVHKPIVRQRGYFIKGKFDQFNRNIPFSAFVIAFRDLMGQLLGSTDAELQKWKEKILEALGESGQVLIEVIPELERIIGQQPPVPQLSGNAAQNRFNLLFEKFIAVFTSIEHPLTIFLDDLQWADSASLNLLKVLMGDSQTGYLLLLGAYRDNEVFPAHPLMLCLGELEKQQTRISTITLAPLSVADIQRLVAETLSCTVEVASPLTDLVYQKTKGNPFFSTQFLKGLHEDGSIGFNYNLGYWECDLVKLREAALTDDVVEFMTRRLHKLPEATQNVMKLAACIGNQFDLETLAIICEKPSEEVAADLWSALREGLILPQSQAYKFFQGWEKDEGRVEGISVGYRFLHDRVQQAAYSLIKSDRKQSTHFKIGQRLLNNTPEETLDEKIFEIVNHLNIGIESADKFFEGFQLAQLNLRAGQQAKATTAYQAAVEYLAVARNLIPTSSWEERYAFTLKLYQESVEAAYLTADFKQMEKFVEIVQNRAQTLLDTIPVYQVKMQAGLAQNKLPEVLQTGRDVLQSLEIIFPETPNSSDVEATISAILSKLTGKAPMSLIELPLMSDPVKLASMRILKNLAPCTYQVMPMLLPLVVIKQVELSVEYGNMVLSPLGYAYFGLILCGMVDDIETGYQFGRLALALLDRLNAEEVKAGTIFIVNTDTVHYREPIQNTLSSLKFAYTLGLETGELEFAALSTYIYFYHSYLIGQPLLELNQELEKYNQTLSKLKQKNSLQFNQILQQAILNLMVEVPEPWQLEGEVYNAFEMLPLHQQANDATAIYYVYFNKMILCYLFGEFQQAVENAAAAKKYLHGVIGNLVVQIFYFYDSLIQLSCSKMWDELEKQIEKVLSNQEKMKHWANYAPMNFQHKYDLIEAEKYRVLGKKLEAIELYDRAIAGAKENSYLQEEALANELAAKFYLDWGKEKYAALHIQEAYYGYARWGAKAKVKDLEKRYPTLLAPILEQEKLSFTPSATLATMIQGTLSKTTTGVGELLDLTTLMKASRTLSEEIELEGAIANLMKVARENAGAETAALMLFEEQVLMLTALLPREDTPQIDPIPVETSNAVPLSIVNKVKRTQEAIALDNASNENAYAKDAYIQQHQPQSILCLPLSDRCQLIGILYLENNRVAGAFTSDRLEVLTLLCSQAAISLENARLYRESQNYSQQLEQTQLQLVQNEKMASIGELAAGVAHEINNPVGFISGNLDYASDYFQDLVELLELYQKELPSPSETILKKIEESELDYLIEDLPQTIGSMKEGIDRITEISKSMRTFSRGDTATKIAFNIHEGIDSTLLILKHRLKANQSRPEIEIVKNYGELPEVNCYPGQLNQVFMNLIANAIDALEEGNSGRSFEEIKVHPNRITITTEVDGQKPKVLVKIKDNGIGMSKEVKEKVFQHLFTTKVVGKGTGLGLSISRQIVEGKHGGKITLISAEGKGTEFAIALPLT